MARFDRYAWATTSEGIEWVADATVPGGEGVRLVNGTPGTDADGRPAILFSTEEGGRWVTIRAEGRPEIARLIEEARTRAESHMATVAAMPCPEPNGDGIVVDDGFFDAMGRWTTAAKRAALHADDN